MKNPVAFPPNAGWRDDKPEDRGMTLRDYFAGQAIMGMQARDMYDSGQDTPEKRASLAYIEADAMLKAREQ